MKIPLQTYAVGGAWFWIFTTGYFLWRDRQPLGWRGFVMAALKGLIGLALFAAIAVVHELHR